MKARWPCPEFLESRQRPPVLAWVWAATGALVLAAAFADGIAVQRRIAAQSAQLEKARDRLAASARALPRRPAAATEADAKLSEKADSQAVQAAQRLRTQLGHPWGLILASVESETPAGMQWLLFDHASDSPELRLEGLAADVASALQAVDSLSAHAGWSDVALGRMQAPDARDGPSAGAAGAAGPLWRFEVRAVLDAQRIGATRSEAGP